MTRRWLDALFCRRPELRPARALLHPTWLGALAVLAVNDHLLKGAGVLPGWLTGKLSDVAGMLVAPALLAALLGVESRRGLLRCHIAVGLVFALINLSPACADAWSWLMGLVGFPWSITVDPTDLLTLPALALGWRAWVPAMQRTAPSPLAAWPRWQPLAQSGAACIGALFCVATSDVEDDWDPGEPTYAPITADVYLHNASADREITVRVRELREDVQLDCFNVEGDDPGVLLGEQLFGEGVTWAIPPGANVPARQDTNITRECHAVLLAGDSLKDQILFWRGDDLPITFVEGQHADIGEYGEGVVVLTPDGDRSTAVTSPHGDLVFPSRAAAEGAYVPGDDGHRVAWSTPPLGVHQITALDLGDDGCAAFTLDDGGVPRFYLCTPLVELPFAPLDHISIEDRGDFILLARERAPGDPTPVPEVQLAASRGQLPQIPGLVIAARPQFDVALGPEPVCGTVAQPLEMSVDFAGQIAGLAVGESVELTDATGTLTLHGVRAERRVVLLPGCAEGPDVLGDDLEFVYVWTATPAP